MEASFPVRGSLRRGGLPSGSRSLPSVQTFQTQANIGLFCPRRGQRWLRGRISDVLLVIFFSWIGAADSLNGLTQRRRAPVPRHYPTMFLLFALGLKTTQTS